MSVESWSRLVSRQRIAWRCIPPSTLSGFSPCKRFPLTSSQGEWKLVLSMTYECPQNKWSIVSICQLPVLSPPIARLTDCSGALLLQELRHYLQVSHFTYTVDCLGIGKMPGYEIQLETPGLIINMVFFFFQCKFMNYKNQFIFIFLFGVYRIT